MDLKYFFLLFQVNGFCIDPNLCVCNDGYHLSYNESEWNMCHAICDPDSDSANSCMNGTCTAPNICTCLLGYEISSESKYICVPVSKIDLDDSYYYTFWYKVTFYVHSFLNGRYWLSKYFYFQDCFCIDLDVSCIYWMFRDF